MGILNDGDTYSGICEGTLVEMCRRKGIVAGRGQLRKNAGGRRWMKGIHLIAGWLERGKGDEMRNLEGSTVTVEGWGKVSDSTSIA